MNVPELIKRMIDQHGLLHVAVSLECVCDEKAEIIKADPNDKRNPKPWSLISRRFGKLAREIEPLEL